MPINRLLQQGKIAQDEVDRLNHAFTLTLKSLHLIDRSDPVCDIVARKVIEIDKAGTHEPQQIAMLAAKAFGFPK